MQNMQTFVLLTGVSRRFNQVQWVLKKLEEQSRAVPKLGPAQSEIAIRSIEAISRNTLYLQNMYNIQFLKKDMQNM